MSASLRSRILSGAVLWTLGLFIAAFGISTVLFMRHRHYAVILHGTTMSHDGLVVFVVAACIVGGFILVRGAVSPLERLRQRLGAVRVGAQPKIDGSYPSEVQPLVDDLNALLAHRDEAVRRAVAKAGDLAHGLKTPLAVLSHEADRARADGHTDLAAILEEQVHRMQRQVDYHLAQARAEASGATPGATSSVSESVASLVRTMERLHADRGVAIEVRVPREHLVKVQREDLDEMLGNLLDNACKWTRTRVQVWSIADGTHISVGIEDDGPGVSPAMRDSVLQRGVRADEAAPGSGLGLAIVRDLAQVYGGSIALETADLGGLRAVLRLPAPDSHTGATKTTNPSS